MRLKIKYSNTQKFVINVEPCTLGNLKTKVREFISSSYGQTVREPLTFSLNGSDPLLGSEDELLSSLGIVPGDMLIVIQPCAKRESDVTTASSSLTHTQEKNCEPSPGTSASSRDMKEESKSVAGNSSAKMSEETSRTENALLEVKDGFPSPSLEKLFTQCSPSSASQAVNLVVHLTMLECGFCLEDNFQVPPGWKEMVATFHYCHPSFSEFKCTLALVTMGEMKQVLASFPQQENAIMTQLKVGDYLKNSSKAVIQATDLVKVAQLSRTLRDSILHPLQIAAHQILGIPAPWHLAGMPHELLLKVASFLRPSSIVNLGQTCKRLLAVMEDNELWRKLYKRDFKNLYNNLTDLHLIDWKAKYKAAIVRHKDWKRLFEEGCEYVIPGMMPPRQPFGPPYPSVPYFPPTPRGPPLYPPQPHPLPNPFYDPDSPYFGGEIPHAPNPFPNLSDPFDPFGMLPRRPGPSSPFNPPFMPPQPRNPRGPRFDFI
ncbi:F-box only protein 7-like [Macrobrachium nipponense]|uniref:F-box only protein 7-like n=1 Tax=Macrobrachium nipponense TaxID=159736 RepID=UPI0030C82427